MDESVAASVAAAVESTGRSSAAAEWRLQLLGPFTVRRGDHELALPASRKLRALFAYLALAPRPVGRSLLCELLWDGPNDPRGELRSALSKIRHAIETAERPRVIARDDRIRLDLDGCRVDALDVE